MKHLKSIKMAKPKIKLYRVDMDMNVSIDYLIKARTAAEARHKAFKRLKGRLARKWFNFWVDREDI